MSRKKQRQIFRPAWKDQFTFSLRERRGFFVLVALLALEVGVLYYLRFIHQPFIEPEWERLILRADSLHRLLRQDVISSPPATFSTEFNTNHKNPDSLFRFDPNSCGMHDLTRLGLSERQAKVFVHYRAAIGKFRKRRDLQKVKVVSPSLYKQWEPFIDLPDTVVKRETAKPTERVQQVDICTMDSAGFERLKGIGPVLAGRIIRYKKRLGGFVSKEQLKEVYGLNDTLFNLVSPQVRSSCDTPERYLGLNSTSEDTLRQHPYIGYKLALQIVRYRGQHPFQQVQELNTLPLVTPEIYRKLAPYLEVR